MNYLGTFSIFSIALLDALTKLSCVHKNSALVNEMSMKSILNRHHCIIFQKYVYVINSKIVAYILKLSE